jgi:peptidoglycan/LPS O-acetylase OafA/YrhL
LTTSKQRLPALDGIRALSIVLVLGAHLLPLGPKTLQLNATAGLMGMALFFALSGFLIVRFLAEGMTVSTFAMRRLARIVPLAWTGIACLWLWRGNDRDLFANLLFVSNLPPARLFTGGEHLWSLCVEVQFYAAVALLCLIPSRRGLYAIAPMCIGVTLFRIADNQPVSIVTWHRVDEILAGGLVALVYCGWFGPQVKNYLGRVPVPVALCILFACSHPAAGGLLYLRPYAGALVLASTIYCLDPISERFLVNPAARYVAEVSYALYVIHGILNATWLGSGDTLGKYLKRPLLFAATFALAHFSTFYLEKPITARAKRATERKSAPPLVSGRS